MRKRIAGRMWMSGVLGVLGRVGLLGAVGVLGAVGLLGVVGEPGAAASSEAARAAPAAIAQGAETDHVIFSINVQDFAYPERSAATLDRILGIHQRWDVPVDFYLTGTMVDLYEAVAPGLVDRLRTSPVAGVAYHIRPPLPHYTGYDWLGLKQMTTAEMIATIRRYETQGLDLRTGQPTTAPGGFAKLSERLGHAPLIAAFQADAEVGGAVSSVFADLGARFTIVHGRPTNLGDRRDGLWIRPEHVDLRLFQHVGEDAGAVIDAAVAEARQTQGARPPYFVGIKIHDNDFFAVDSAWVTTYVQGKRRPPWDLGPRSPLLAEAEQAAMWSLYEGAVAHVGGHKDRLTALKSDDLLAMVTGQDRSTPQPSQAPTAVPTAEPTAASTAAPTAAPTPIPAAGTRPLLYVSGTMHIETNRQSWPNAEQLIAFFQRATAAGRSAAQPGGMRWSLGADIGWLEGEPRAAELLRALEAMGVEMDVHAHQLADRADCAAALSRFGVHPNRVASGVVVTELDALRQPLTARGGSAWQAEVVWGLVYQPNHGSGSDERSYGLWRPKRGSEPLVHDPAGELIAVGGGLRDLAAIEQTAQVVAVAGADVAPVLSASIIVNSRDFALPNGTDGIEAIEAWAARLAANPALRWATISETAAAWLAAGGIPSRFEGTALPAGAVAPTATIQATTAPTATIRATPVPPTTVPSTTALPTTAPPTTGARRLFLPMAERP